MEETEVETPKKFDFSSGETKEVTGTLEEVDDFLSGFKKPMTVDREDAPPLGEKPAYQSPPTDNTTQYYVRGPKKGQPKPYKTPPYSAPPPAPTPAAPTSHTLGGELLTGALFLLLVDMLVPALIALVNNMVSKVKVESDDLKLTAKQKSELEPIADRVVKYINLDEHPIALYCLCTFAMYSMTLLQARLNAEMK